MNTPAKNHAFFIIQVADGRGIFGFQVYLADTDFADELLDVFARDLLGQQIKMYSLELPPTGVNHLPAVHSMAAIMKQLMARCRVEPSPGQTFLVTYVEYWRQQIPLRVIAAFLEAQPQRARLHPIACSGYREGVPMKRTHVIRSSSTAAYTPDYLDFLCSRARGDLAAVMASIAATRG